MKIPRFLAVFVSAAGAGLAAAIIKALVVGSFDKLPPLKVLLFAASNFGLVAALIDWGLLRDLLPGKRTKAAKPSAREGRTEHVTASRLPEAPAPKADPIIERARVRPIVFREICPPPAGMGLSFYGGVPVGPPTLAWPRVRNKPGATPLSFIMQWNCPELARQDVTGILPKEGVLYLFGDLTWGDPFDFEFVHAHGPVDGWNELPIPQNLPPVYGDEGVHLVRYCSPRIAKESQDVPSLLPKWPFTPVAFSYPISHNKVNVEDEPGRFWNESDAVAEAMLLLEHPEGVPPPKRLDNQQKAFGRPFPAFPHNYAVVRVVCAEVLAELRRPNSRILREVSEHEREAKCQAWSDEAERIYVSAAIHPLAGRVEQSLSDDIWRWMEGLEPVLGLGWNSLVEECVNVSLGLGSDAALVPADRIAACADRHRLAMAYLHEEYPNRRKPESMTEWDARKAAGSLKEVRSLHAPCPNHMFGPPSYVQGYVEEYLEEWVLLLELPSRHVIGFELGDGVLQFMIRPADLREGRFENVKLVASSY